MTAEEVWARSYQKRDSRPTQDWAPDYVELLPPLSRTGRFSVNESRHFIGPLDAMWDDNVRQVNICGPPRGGKTLLVEIDIHSSIVRKAGPFLWSFQDEEAADDEASFRLWNQLLANPLIAPQLHQRTSKNKTIQGPRWLLQIVGPADSNFQSRGYKRVYLDEVWLYKRGKVQEARGRLGDFVKLGTDKFVLLSQGGDADSDWDVEFNRGVVHDWNVECQKCGHFMPPLYRAFRPDGSRWGFVFNNYKNERGQFIESKVIPTVRFECEKCGHPHISGAKTRREWNRTGKYVAEANSEKREARKSFRWTALIDSPFEEECALYIGALNSLKSGNPIPLIKFLQKSGAEMTSETSVLLGGQTFATIEVASPEWKEATVRLMGVDKQAEHYWAEIRDFSSGLGGESRRVWWGKLYSYAEIEQKRIEYKVSDIGLDNIPAVFIDSGYDARGQGGVYAACARYDWTAVKGVGTLTGERKPEFGHHLRTESGEAVTVKRSYSEIIPADPEIGTAQQGVRFARLVRFSSDVMADLLDSFIERGLYKEPQFNQDDPLEVERKRQFAAEYKKLKVDKFTGRTTEVRVCPSKNNHAYDLGKILKFGAVLTGVIPDPYDEQVKAT